MAGLGIDHAMTCTTTTFTILVSDTISMYQQLDQKVYTTTNNCSTIPTLYPVVAASAVWSSFQADFSDDIVRSPLSTQRHSFVSSFS
jgi:hypothetical protein